MATPAGITDDARSHARHLLAQFPGRVTKPRIETCACLMQSQHPLSHAELQERLPRINRVSLYRALEWMEQQQLCVHLNGSDGVRRYAWQSDRHDHEHHAHFQCQRCGTTLCLEDMAITPSTVPKGYQVLGTSLIVHGICETCGDNNTTQS